MYEHVRCADVALLLHVIHNHSSCTIYIIRNYTITLNATLLTAADRVASQPRASLGIEK